MDVDADNDDRFWRKSILTNILLKEKNQNETKRDIISPSRPFCLIPVPPPRYRSQSAVTPPSISIPFISLISFSPFSSSSWPFTVGSFLIIWCPFLLGFGSKSWVLLIIILSQPVMWYDSNHIRCSIMMTIYTPPFFLAIYGCWIGLWILQIFHAVESTLYFIRHVICFEGVLLIIKSLTHCVHSSLLDKPFHCIKMTCRRWKTFALSCYCNSCCPTASNRLGQIWTGFYTLIYDSIFNRDR